MSFVAVFARKRYVCRFPLVIGTFGLISDPSNPMVKLACLAAALLFIGASSSTIGTRVANVNTGTASELDALYGVGPAIAARVVAFREAHGPFLARVAARSRTVCLTADRVLQLQPSMPPYGYSRTLFSAASPNQVIKINA